MNLFWAQKSNKTALNWTKSSNTLRSNQKLHVLNKEVSPTVPDTPMCPPFCLDAREPLDRLWSNNLWLAVEVVTERLLFHTGFGAVVAVTEGHFDSSSCGILISWIRRTIWIAGTGAHEGTITRKDRGTIKRSTVIIFPASAVNWVPPPKKSINKPVPERDLLLEGT